MTTAKKRRYSGYRGFTLIEILIVVIVLGILAAIVIPQFAGASDDAKATALEADLQNIQKALEYYKLQHNESYPILVNLVDQMTLASKLDGTTATPGTAGFPFGPYLQEIPNNPYTSTNTIGTGARGTSAWYYNENTGQFRDNDIR